MALSFLHLLPLPLLLTSSLATPTPAIPAAINTPALEAACRSPSPRDLPNPTCWDILDMDTWLTSWKVNTSAAVDDTTGQPLTPPAGKFTCNAEEAWSTCFLRFLYPSSNIHCTEPGTSACSDRPQVDVMGLATKSAEYYYANYAIWFLNEYFSHLYLEVQPLDPTTRPMNVQTLTAFLRGSPPWVADTALHGIDIAVADLIEPHDDAEQHAAAGDRITTLSKVVLSTWPSGIPDGPWFLQLAKGGNLLHSPL